MNTRRRPVRLVAAVMAAAISFVVTACGGDSSAAARDGIVRVAVFPSLNALGARTAAAEGMFEKAGMRVEFVNAATPAEALPQLVGGKVDFALMDVSTPTIARSQGMPIVMVAPGAVGTAVNSDGMGVGNFWVRADSDIDSVGDLENAVFGIPQTKSQLWIDVRRIIDGAGANSSKTQFIEVPNSPAALKSGSVDVVTSAEPAGTAMGADPDMRLLKGFVSGRVGELAYSYVATEELARTNPKLVEKFRSVVVRANERLNSDPSLAPKVAASYVDAPPELLDEAVYQKFGEQPVDRDDVVDARKRVLRYGLIDADEAPSPDEMLAGG